MSPLLIFGAVAVVDRVEEDIAVLEWRDMSFSEVPVELLPAGVQEGDRVLLRSRTLPRSPALRMSGARPRGATWPRHRGAVAAGLPAKE